MVKSGNRFAYDPAYYEKLARNIVVGNNAVQLDAQELEDGSYDEFDELFGEEPEMSYVSSCETEPEGEYFEEEKAREYTEEKKAKAVKPAAGKIYVPEIHPVRALLVLSSIAVILVSLFATARISYKLVSTEKQIASAETLLSEAVAHNKALCEHLDTTLDRNYIYTVAVGKLGMVYPDNNAVSYYSPADEGYVRQFASIG